MSRSARLGLGSFLVGALLHVVPTVPAAAADLVLLRAHCVDPLARTVQERSLWVSDGVIRGIGSAGGEDLPGESVGAPRFDLAGAYVLPALADAWVHAGTQRSPGHRDRVGAAGTAQLALAAGVVEFTDVHLESEALVERERARGEDLPRARIRVGGPLITAPGGIASDLPGARLVRDGLEAAALVDSLAARAPSLRPDLLAFVFDGSRRNPRLGQEALRAGLERAAAHGLPAAVQVGTWRDVYDALDCGAHWLVQLPFGPVPELVAERLERSEVVWTPMVALGQEFAALLTDPALREDPLLAIVLPQPLRTDYGQVRVPQGRMTEVAQRRAATATALTILRERGVRFRAGSSAGAVGTAFGWTLLRELEWMVQSGIDVWDALASALPVQTTGLAAIAVGARGDLIVLPRSPVDDITALRTIESVVFGGRRLDPPSLAGAVTRTLEEEIPQSPLPFGGRVPMFVLVAGGFVLLLLVRRSIKKAAERAATEV